MSKLKTILLVMVFLLSVPVSSALAVQIDFTDSTTFSAAHGETDYHTVIDGWLDVTLRSRWFRADNAYNLNNLGGNADAPKLTYNNPPGGEFYEIDGIGADNGKEIFSNPRETTPSYEFDEIEGDERVIVEFGESVEILDFSVTDLFHENDYDEDPLYYEKGYFQLLRGDVWSGSYGFTAQDQLSSPISNGQYTHYDFGPNSIIDAIMFYAPGYEQGINGDGDALYEFSLAEINVKSAPVPEPATMLLLGIGLVGIATANRKKIKDR